MTDNNGTALAQNRERGLTFNQVSELTGYTLAQIALIRTTVAKDAPIDEIAVFLHSARHLGLDPLLRQCYWIRRKGKGALQVGIDGFRAIADRSGAYAGSEPIQYRGQIELRARGGTVVVPEVATARIWKIVQGHRCCFVGEARWTEYYPGDGDEGFMYRKMPYHMLGKDAEAQALRRGWPSDLATVELRADSDAPEASGITVVEQPDKRRGAALNAARYAEVYGSEDSGTMFDQPETRAATTPPAAASEGRSGDDSQSSPGASSRLVTNKKDPLWQEWLKEEESARQADIELDTSRVQLGITEEALWASIDSVREAIAEKASTTALAAF